MNIVGLDTNWHENIVNRKARVETTFTAIPPGLLHSDTRVDPVPPQLRSRSRCCSLGPPFEQPSSEKRGRSLKNKWRQRRCDGRRDLSMSARRSAGRELVDRELPPPPTLTTEELETVDNLIKTLRKAQHCKVAEEAEASAVCSRVGADPRCPARSFMSPLATGLCRCCGSASATAASETQPLCCQRRTTRAAAATSARRRSEVFACRM